MTKASYIERIKIKKIKALKRIFVIKVFGINLIANGYIIATQSFYKVVSFFFYFISNYVSSLIRKRGEQ